MWASPWLQWRKHRPPSAEAGLGVEHGVSYYGPCTGQKVAVEYKRLTDLVESIRRVGYVPSTPIRGFVLRRNEESRFFVRGGKHRAAVLAYLGYQAVPVSLKRGWPMIVDRREAGEWPLVRDGRISRDLAERVLDRYFDYDGSQQAAALGIATG